jgi:hypothetical protein
MTYFVKKVKLSSLFAKQLSIVFSKNIACSEELRFFGIK